MLKVTVLMCNRILSKQAVALIADVQLNEKNSLTEQEFLQ